MSAALVIAPGAVDSEGAVARLSTSMLWLEANAPATADTETAVGSLLLATLFVHQSALPSCPAADCTLAM